MPLSVDQFAKAVIVAGLATTDEVKSLWGKIAVADRPKDGAAFAKLLLQQKILSPFQATEILSRSEIPLVLGDYVLLGRIGEGGMGQVFKAQHRHMERLAAIKLLPKELTKDEAAVKRFQREVKAAAKLSHPNIVQTHDAGVQRGVWYLVMEYAEGTDLGGIPHGPQAIAVPQAINYILQAARGLAFAHSKGVVHRDIKPANLLLNNDGVIKILDMGLAFIENAVQTANEGLTKSGQVMGTIDYMAPEQAYDMHLVDARADIYSLGCTLFRLLTGKNMYEGDTMVRKIMAHQTKPIPSLSAERGDIPPWLTPIFERMVQKTPDARYQTMAEIVTVLESSSGTNPQGGAAGQNGIRSPGMANRGLAVPKPIQAASGSSPSHIVTAPRLTNPIPVTASHPNPNTVSLNYPLQSTDSVSHPNKPILAPQVAPSGLSISVSSSRKKSSSSRLAIAFLVGVFVAFVGLVVLKGRKPSELPAVVVPELNGDEESSTPLTPEASQSPTVPSNVPSPPMPSAPPTVAPAMPDTTPSPPASITPSPPSSSYDASSKSAAGNLPSPAASSKGDPVAAIGIAGPLPLTIVEDAKTNRPKPISGQPANLIREWPFDPPDGQKYQWSSPQPVDMGMSTTLGFPSLSSNQNFLVVRRYLSNDIDYLIFSRSYPSTKSWDRSFYAKILGNDSAYSACISNDGLSVIYARYVADKKTTDLWMVHRRSSTSDEWEQPVDLGPTINSDATDAFPTFSLDGSGFAFQSNRAGGLGKNDIYYCRAVDSSRRNWEPPVNLGAPFNSSQNDSNPLYMSDGKSMYLVRDELPIVVMQIGGETKEYLVPTDGRMLTIQWLSPDGRTMYFSQNDRQSRETNSGIAVSYRIPIASPAKKPSFTESQRSNDIGPISPVTLPRSPSFVPLDEADFAQSPIPTSTLPLIAKIPWPFDPQDGREYYWGKPKPVELGINEAQDFPTLTSSQNYLLFQRSTTDKKHDYLIFSRSSAASNTWGRSTYATIPDNDIVGSATISQDGLSVVYARRTGNNGTTDLWIVHRKNKFVNEWEQPVSLGPTINSDANELNPTFSSRGTRLAFQSNRAGGLGGYDIYVCYGNDRRIWTPAANMKAPFCDELNDGFPRFMDDDKTMFLVRDRLPLVVMENNGETKQYLLPPARFKVQNPWLSPDGRTMYFIDEVGQPGRTNPGIAVSHREPATSTGKKSP